MRELKHAKLTCRTAVELICSVVPVKKKDIRNGEAAPGVPAYTVQAGALEITCTIDRDAGSGLFLLIIEDALGGNCIRMCFRPDTLERDFFAERAYKEEILLKTRQKWVWRVGKEQAHKLVDQYWGD